MGYSLQMITELVAVVLIVAVVIVVKVVLPVDLLHAKIELDSSACFE